MAADERPPKPDLEPGCTCRYVWQKLPGHVGQWVFLISRTCKKHHEP